MSLMKEAAMEVVMDGGASIPLGKWQGTSQAPALQLEISDPDLLYSLWPLPLASGLPQFIALQAHRSDLDSSSSPLASSCHLSVDSLREMLLACLPALLAANSEVFWMDGHWEPITIASCSSKPYLRSPSIQCYLCLLLNSHFLTEAGIHVFVLGCVSAGLPKTEASWEDVKRDLEIIENFTQFTHIDATLYTESNVHPNCKVTAMKCFLLELQVILHESRDEEIHHTVENLLTIAKSSLTSNGNITESGCKECEELEEKNITEFLQSFVHIVQMFINPS
ncbi:interleukin-15 [Ctenodactylus gundi]